MNDHQPSLSPVPQTDQLPWRDSTLLHQLGINHEAFTYRSQGRDYRLTDVHGHVVKAMLA